MSYITKFLVTFFGSLFFIGILVGSVSGIIFMAIEITTYFGPYENDKIATIITFAIVMIELSVLFGCARACEDL